MKVHFELPMPPSVNHYYNHGYDKIKKKVIMYVNNNGKLYRQKVFFLAANKIPKANNPFYTARALYVIIKFNPASPLRDIDNPFKCLFDAITKNYIWHDDRQVKKMYVEISETTSPKDNLEMTITDNFDTFIQDVVDRLRSGSTPGRIITK